MKKSIVSFTLLIAVLFVTSVLTSCGGKKTEQMPEQTEEVEHQHVKGDTTHHDDMPMDSTQTAYACPMHPEVTGKEGDMCSKCGMKLELTKGNNVE